MRQRGDMIFGNPVCEKCGARHPISWDCEAQKERARKQMEAALDRMLSMPEKETLYKLRDAFLEITAKARPFLFDPKDPERIIAYVIPCGPLHRAAGITGQLFDGEKYMEAATDRIRELEAEIAALKS